MLSLQTTLLTAAVVFLTSLPVLHYAANVSLSTSLLLACFAAYLPSYFDGSECDPHNSRFSPWLQRLWLWRPLLSYFPCRLLMDGSAEEYRAAGSQFIMTLHPHGIACWSHFLIMTDGVGALTAGGGVPANRRDIAASVLFHIPLVRDLLLSLGCLDASSSTCNRILRSGFSMQLYPGGEREQLQTPSAPLPPAWPLSSLLHSSSSSPSSSAPFTSIIVASSRRGFIRLALQYSLPVLPCFCFGEDQLYYTSQLLLPLRLRLAAALRIALPFAVGRYGSIAPHARELVLVVGRPLLLPGSGTGEERVEAGLKLYCAAMQQLFDQHKGSVDGYQKAQLDIRG